MNPDKGAQVKLGRMQFEFHYQNIGKTVIIQFSPQMCDDELEQHSW